MMLIRYIHSVVLVGVVLSQFACQSTTAAESNGTAPAGTGFLSKTLVNAGRERRYTVFVPHSYRADRRWPAIMFLHGIGEAGSSAQGNLTVGLGPIVAEYANTFPFIVIFPQSTGGWDENSQAATDAIAALHKVSQEYAVDTDRVYLTGLSTGGYGTWAMGAKYRHEFAALVPLCAYTSYKDVPELAKIPIWCFHNGGDPFVLAGSSSGMCDEINHHGGHARYTQYETIGHNCWDQAYRNRELYAWLLQQRRSTEGRPGGVAAHASEVRNPALAGSSPSRRAGVIREPLPSPPLTESPPMPVY